FGRRMERLAQRRQQLGQREEQLRHVVLKFDAFLKASAAREERALRRAEEERAKVARQEAETTRLRRELEGLLQLRERLARRLRSLRGFEDYLQGFQDIPAMLAHFGMLVETRAALAQRAEAGQEQLAQGRALLREYQEEASSELLRAQDELTQLRARLEAAHHDVLQQESRWAHIQSMVAQKTLLLGQIKLAVLNLFQLAAAQLKVPTDVALEDTEAQLDTVSAALCPGCKGKAPPSSPAPKSPCSPAGRLWTFLSLSLSPAHLLVSQHSNLLPQRYHHQVRGTSASPAGHRDGKIRGQGTAHLSPWGPPGYKYPCARLRYPPTRCRNSLPLAGKL
uniref:DUF4200 domain-containing protein n=1 Tax=Calidris pygmaea TaxID=425635 RepID=A0A8C3KSJ5_9CHAR